MEVSLGELEELWPRYTAWCHSNGLNPGFKDFMIYLDDQDLMVNYAE